MRLSPQVAAFEGATHIVQLLIDYRANIDMADKDGFTPLMVSAFRGHLDIVKILMDHRVDFQVGVTEVDLFYHPLINAGGCIWVHHHETSHRSTHSSL